MQINQHKQHEHFMREAIRLAFEGMRQRHGGPFGAVIVKDGEIIGRGHNQVAHHCDPTAHAEITAIREACRQLGHFQLTGCTIYSSCEPCPMCFGAIYWARPDRFFYACTRQDAASIDFDDNFIYSELELPPQARKISAVPLLREEALLAFEEWKQMENKIVY